MAEKSPSAGAVFLSYAREDSEGARRIADALRAFGLEVWFDQSELRGGDSWDVKIKTQIRTCSLFLPIISAHTQKRAEGYFRREWKFGVERTHDMASGTAFIVPVVIDDTSEASALVPEEFMRFQWTRLPHGIPTAHFIEQVKQLVENPRVPGALDRPAATRADTYRPTASTGKIDGPRRPYWAVGAVVAVIAVAAVVVFLARKPQPLEEAPVAAAQPKAADAAPVVSAKSIAVLPFANFSPDKDNEFFADGLQDEVITALAKIHDLKVISRTSVLAYRNPEGRNLKKIGNELGVAVVLEGSVQRIGSKVHLNVQLIDARTDDHLWANSYTEDLTDVFTLESALAQQIATELKASLTSDEQELIARRPTQNQEAYDLYLRGRVLQEGLGSKSGSKDIEDVIAIFEKAAAKDPMFSLPHAQTSILHDNLYWFSGYDSSDERRAKALAELETAQRLAPNAPETLLAQAEYDYACVNDWTRALSEYRAASVGLPNDDVVHYGIGRSLRRLGRYTEALVEFEKSSALNPNDDNSAFTIVETHFALHQYQKSVDSAAYFQTRFPQEDFIASWAAAAQYQLDGDYAALLAKMSKMNVFAESESLVAFRRAMLAVDLPAAERALSSPDITSIADETGSINDPVALWRAYIAYLLGKKDEAKANSEECIANYRKTAWTRRQLPWSHLGIARAEAYEGLVDEAVRDGKAAYEEMAAFDIFDSTVARNEYGKILVIAGRNDEAIAILREVIASPLEVPPRGMAVDPVWGRLKSDPRFQGILDSVRPL